MCLKLLAPVLVRVSAFCRWSGESERVMNPAHVARLREEQKNAIEQTEQKLQTLRKFKDDYEALESRLETLPHKITHDVMVPFGKLAFMPGKLVHTNEIMVLLGDNWFAERSAKQAAEIVQRRTKVLSEDIAQLEKQKGLLEPRLDFTSELEMIAEDKDVKEIREEYDDKKEKQWREQHRKSWREHRQKEKKEMSLKMEKVKQDEAKREETKKQENKEVNADLWARLDQLEEIEANEKELDSFSDEEEGNKSSDRRVKWVDQQASRCSEEEEEEGEGSSESDNDDQGGGDVRACSSVINFTHTPPESSQVPLARLSPDEISSPGDIYRKFSSIPKSILKSRPEDDVVTKSTLLQKQIVSEQASTSLPQAFTGQIVEKAVSEAEVSEPAQERPMSRFKQRRMQAKQS